MDKAWIKALQINPSDVKAWAEHLPSSMSLTFWCLLNDKIPTSSYLTWAREHYGLAVLKDGYFEQPVDKTLWQQIQTVANWSPQLLPLCEWDGIVFVGCVEPPQEVNWSFPVRYVLASAENLQSHWEALHQAETQTPPVETIAPPPPPPTEISLEPEAHNPEPQTSETHSPEESDVPEGLQLGDFQASSAAAPEGIQLSGFDLPPIPEDLSVSEPPPETPETLDLQPEGLSLNLETPAPSTPAPVPVPAPETSESLSPEEDSLANHPVMKDSFSSRITEAPSALAPDGAVIDTKGFVPNEITEAQDENQAIAWGFKKLKDHFSRSMILLFEGENLKPWKWEKSWAPRSESNFQPFAVNKPGIFRIVQRTGLPYHGHVVPSDANKEFFLNWGYDSLPAHATVVPMTVNDHPIGVLLCVGEASANSQQALVFADRMSNKLTEALSALHSQAA